MTALARATAPHLRAPSARRTLQILELTAATVVGGVLVGYLVAHDLWFVAVGLLGFVPGCIVLLRYPWSAVIVWVLVTPIAGTTDGAGVRAVYWLVHRGLPVWALMVVIVGAATGVRPRRLPRLGLPEVLMAGYLTVTAISILYTAPVVIREMFVFYDRVFVPMCLYLLVRLLVPDERDIARLLPAVVVVLVAQSVIGMMSWIGPAALRPEWLGKVGERTVGTLQSADLFGATMIFCAVFILHCGFARARTRAARVATMLAFGLAILMVFMSFSRATWLAGVLMLLGLAVIFRQYLHRIVVVGAVLLVLLGITGVLNTQWQYAQYRFDSSQSEESALSRLPVFLAAVRMFQAKPVTGFGYENFDRVSRPFQGRIGDLVYPDKNHASHNLFLTLLAEQGIVGFVLYLGPLLVWLARSVARRSRLPAEGVLGRRFVAVLWLALLAHIVVNNFSRMHLPFGLGLYWLTLGLVATLVGRVPARTSPAAAAAEVRS
jgi:O-antigen ligase